MSQIERQNYIIDLYQKLNPELQVTEKTEIKNASIAKICQYNAGAFHRVKEWLETTLAKKESEEKSKLQTQEIIDKDLEEAKTQLSKAFAIMKERSSKYGASWKVIDVRTIAQLIEMKMNRISQLGEYNTKTEDEMIDTINYACFALLKLKKNKNQPFSNSSKI